MKKRWCLMLSVILIMVFVLFGCNDDGESVEENSISTVSEETDNGEDSEEETVVNEAGRANPLDWEYAMKTSLREALTKFVFDATKRRPMILTVVKTIY